VLPRDMSLDELDTLHELAAVNGSEATTDVEAQPTVPLMPAVPGGIDSVATLQLPSVQPRPQPELQARARKGLALMPQAAGLTDPGVKRAADPNPDNILAVQSIRLVDGAAQPHALSLDPSG